MENTMNNQELQEKLKTIELIEQILFIKFKKTGKINLKTYNKWLELERNLYEQAN